MIMLVSLTREINNIIEEDPANTFNGKYRFYDHPLLAVASASDYLFTELKNPKIVGQLFRLPSEWLPDAASVISYFLPFSLRVRTSNRSLGAASPEWIHARFFGEKLNNTIRHLIVSQIEKAGGRALAPVGSPGFILHYDNCCSNWSERHVAYIAGLGTFGINRSLITEKGSAGRFGSVITDLNLPSTRRSYETPFQYCPFLKDGSCGVCIDRCPTSSITPSGKNNKICHDYIFSEHLKAFTDQYGYPHSACGKCQISVPCEDRIP
jgi:epoxyqueuosine reductase